MSRPADADTELPADSAAEPLTPEEEQEHAAITSALQAEEKRLTALADSILRDLKHLRWWFLAVAVFLVASLVVPIISSELSRDRTTPLPALTGGSSWKSDSALHEFRQTGAGSRQQPYAVDDSIRTGGWTFAIAEVSEDVTEELLAAEPERPAPGVNNRFLRIAFTATRDEPVTPETAPEHAEMMLFEYLSEDGVGGIELITLADVPGGIVLDPRTVRGTAPTGWPEQIAGSLVFRMPQDTEGELRIQVGVTPRDSVLVAIPRNFP
ncbi:hypothetical protein [Leucobacter sp. M11]|uniref:hypothetical protein n=1 Tax=Leucobacter sp. M11 TaxID=2993565 RepID=UPI002D8022E8|nr:hypothetical protein [Leucobacter sp. M11]MEB4613018.1 hypothetical protein [Leucobacter sp. M11]